MIEFGDKRLPDKFWERAEVKDCGYISLCWIWRKRLNNSGYGGFKMNGVSTTAHRWAFIAINGEIESNLVIDHLCRNRACVNPSHLQAVTQKQNLSTAIGLGEKGMVYLAELNKQRQAKTHCPHGHPYDEQNTYLEERGTFRSKHCKTCRDANVRKLRERGYFKSYKRPIREANK